jgi:hypothetical protein
MSQKKKRKDPVLSGIRKQEKYPPCQGKSPQNKHPAPLVSSPLDRKVGRNSGKEICSRNISSRQEKNRALYPVIKGALQNCLREVLVRCSRGNSCEQAGLRGDTKKKFVPVLTRL